jgi:uncharacterized protein (TIGR03905 family)
MQISFDLEGNVVKNVVFTGGCDGNLKAISRVVEGMTVEQIEDFFRGIQCGRKTSSCSDQLAIAVREAYNNASESA